MSRASVRAFLMLLEGYARPNGVVVGECEPFVRITPTGATLRLVTEIVPINPTGETLHICREVT